MNRFISICSLLMVGFFIISGTQKKSQGLVLLHADKSVSSKGPEGLVREFVGNVHFQQDTLEMFCDRAIYYSDQKKIRFSDHVRIYSGSQAIFAQQIDYFPETKQAICTGNVRISSQKDSLACAYLIYNFKTEEAQAEGNLYLYDRPESVHIWGERGWYNPASGISRVSSDARLMRTDSVSGDTLFIDAGILEYRKQAVSYAVAIDSVIIRQKALRAVCDTAFYYPDSAFILLKKSPHAWYEDSELQGVEMRVQLDSLRIRSIRLKGEAVAESLADTARSFTNRLEGKMIDFKIEEKKPRLITAMGSASSIYYLEDEDGEYQGANFATADTIRIFFKQGKLDSITIIGGAQGIYYPANYQGEKKFAE